MRAFTEELLVLERASLRRSLRSLGTPQGVTVTTGNRPLLNFSSNDYLGLAAHPLVVETMIAAVEKYGAGSGASRLVCGTLAPHSELEETLATIKGTEAALSFSSGHAAAMGTLGAVLRPGDMAIVDRLSHACLIDGARASGATVRSFRHNDMAQLEERLVWAAARLPATGRTLVITEGIFSMDGDRAPLRAMADLTRRYRSLLLVDEAHSFGLCGPQGRGLAAACGVTDGVDLHLGTLSKAVGLAGGYVAASRAAIDLIINRARSFIYSTAPPPALAATATFVLREIFEGPLGGVLRDRLWTNVRQLGGALPGREPSNEPASAILPLILGSEEAALHAAGALQEAGFLVPAIRPPTVPRGQSRLRLTLSAAHTSNQIDSLISALQTLGPAIGRAHT